MYIHTIEWEYDASPIVDSHFNWRYVAVIYSDSEYGIHCYETLRDVAANDTICFTTPQRVIRDQFEALDYEQIIRNINNINDIRGKAFSKAFSSYKDHTLCTYIRNTVCITRKWRYKHNLICKLDPQGLCFPWCVSKPDFHSLSPQLLFWFWRKSTRRSWCRRQRGWTCLGTTSTSGLGRMPGATENLWYW